jgi:hypothetical protein
MAYLRAFNALSLIHFYILSVVGPHPTHKVHRIGIEWNDKQNVCFISFMCNAMNDDKKRGETAQIYDTCSSHAKWRARKLNFVHAEIEEKQKIVAQSCRIFCRSHKILSASQLIVVTLCGSIITLFWLTDHVIWLWPLAGNQLTNTHTHIPKFDKEEA